MMSCSGKTPVPNSSIGFCARNDGKPRGSLPKVNSTTLSSTMPPATVAISQPFEPRSANGRTSVRSTTRPNSAQSSSAIATASGSGQPSLTAKV